MRIMCGVSAKIDLFYDMMNKCIVHVHCSCASRLTISSIIQIPGKNDYSLNTCSYTLYVLVHEHVCKCIVHVHTCGLAGSD